MSVKIKKYARKTLKILLWIIGSIIGLFLLIVVLIQVPAIQNVIKDKAVAYLEDKIKTPVRIDRIEIGLPKKVIIEGVYLQTQQGDTLFFGERMALDISLLRLLSNEVEVNSIDLRGITANVTRDKDSIFNFGYIIKAFDSGKPKDTSGAPMTFSIDKINLDRIKVRFDDEITKNDLTASLYHLDTRVKKFDMEKSEYAIPKITLDGLKVNLTQGQLVREIGTTTTEVADSLAKKPDIKLDLGEIDLRRISVAYDNGGTHLNSGVSLDKLLVQFNETNIAKQFIDIDKFQISGLRGGLTLAKYIQQQPSAEKVKTTAATPNNWRVVLADADISNVNFRFDDENAARTRRGIDYKHMNLQDFNLKAEKISYSADVISGNLTSLTVKDKSGLHVESLHTNFYYGPTKAYLKDLYIKTPQTLIKDNIEIEYPSLDALQNNIGDLALNANLDQSRVGFKDILIFVPDLAKNAPFKDNQNAILLINGRVNGSVSDINIPNMEISGIGNTRLAASGRITGLPDAKNAYFDMNIRDFQSTARDLNNFVPTGTIPASVQLPSQLGLKGTFVGKMDNFSTNMNLSSSYGGAKIVADFDSRVKNREKYKANAQLNNFDVGRLIKNDSIGRVTLTAKVNGTGLNPKTATASVDGRLVQAVFNSYTYHDLALKGNIRSGEFNVTAAMDDPNLDFDLASEGSFRDKYPAVKVRLNVDIADLDKLNLHAGPMKIRGKVDADLATANPDYLNGTVNAYHFVVANEKDQFILDSIKIAALATPDSTSLTLKSQFMRAAINGKYQLTQIGTALSNTIAKYYNPTPAAIKPKTDPQEFDFELTVNNDPVLIKLVPKITRLEPININGSYRSATDSLMVHGTIPRLVFGTNTISGGVIDVKTEENALIYAINLDQVENAQFLLPNTNLSGSVSDNVVAYTLEIRDKKDDQHYLIAGTLTAENGNTILHLQPDGLVLNYEPWNISPENMLRFGKSGLYANNFELSHEGSSLRLQSQSTAANAPLEGEFTDFDIATVTKMVQKEGDEAMAVGGTINGNVLLRNLTTKPVFTSDLNIENFSFQKDTVGNISIRVDNRIANTYTADVEITGQGNQVNLDGTYRDDTSSFNLDLNMQQLQLKSIQGFTMGNMTKSSGFLSGRFKITGTAAAPNVRGRLKFNDGAFTITPLNSAFSLVNDEISFDEQGILFNKFSLSDEKGNKLALNGRVLTQTYSDFGFDLQVRADNFRAVNSSAKDSDLFYGKLFLDTRLNIKGDVAKPVVDGTIKINEDTDFSVVLPQSDPAVADREGIVEFIDQDNPQLTEKLILASDSLNQSQLKGMNISVNIEIVKEAELSLIIDKGNGDYLSLKGEGRLNGGIDPSGKTSLTGRYEITEGAYEMSFNFIRRKFDIREGSSILWTGEPTEATIDITAVYTANTAPIDLVGDQLGNVSAAVRNTYKQRLPFETHLKMNGELLKPEITFDIVLPEGNYSVATDIVNTSRTKLEQLRQQPSELNKQVFALLLLNRFIGENPFASEAGSASAESLARQSVSKILSQQLNDLAGDLISGVQLEFDLESTEDYTTGSMENRTDLNVGISKQLLNDRLKVTVGSSFGLEGPQQANQESTNIAGDVALDYQLTKDGRYVVRAYRKNEYQVAIQGEVIETGVAFIITMDYDKFRELFHRTKEEKRLMRQMKKKEKEKKEQDRLEKEKELKEEQEDTNKVTQTKE
ncbi:MAG TPA: translocation/assembly module TamB domain-containing protein [Flavobacterium sp.]|jgi:hypothetical protein